MKAYIVWNEGKTEGVIFRDNPSDPKIYQTAERDAMRTANGGSERITISSSLGQAFYELYDDQDLTVQECEVEI